MDGFFTLMDESYIKCRLDCTTIHYIFSLFRGTHKIYNFVFSPEELENMHMDVNSFHAFLVATYLYYFEKVS